MIRARVAVALLFPGYAAACTWVDKPPSPSDLIQDLDQVIEDQDVILRGYVGEFLADGGITIEVAEKFKGADHLGEPFVYRAITSCDSFYMDTGGEYLFFGAIREGKIHFMLGNGAVRSDHPIYPRLLEELRDKQANQTSVGD